MSRYKTLTRTLHLMDLIYRRQDTWNHQMILQNHRLTKQCAMFQNAHQHMKLPFITNCAPHVFISYFRRQLSEAITFKSGRWTTVWSVKNTKCSLSHYNPAHRLHTFSSHFWASKPLKSEFVKFLQLLQKHTLISSKLDMILKQKFTGMFVYTAK